MKAKPKSIDASKFSRHAQLSVAAYAGNASGVQNEINAGADPKANDSIALRRAAARGHIECVKLLIPFSDPQAQNSLALREAAANGRVECVRLLIPVSNPKELDSIALSEAAIHGQIECVRLLIPVSDCNEAREWLTVREQGGALLDAVMQEESLKAKYMGAGGAGTRPPAL